MRLALAIDWNTFADRSRAPYLDRCGQPGIPTRLMAGLPQLKGIFTPGDEGVMRR